MGETDFARGLPELRHRKMAVRGSPVLPARYGGSPVTAKGNDLEGVKDSGPFCKRVAKAKKGLLRPFLFSAMSVKRPTNGSPDGLSRFPVVIVADQTRPSSENVQDNFGGLNREGRAIVEVSPSHATTTVGLREADRHQVFSRLEQGRTTLSATQAVLKVALLPGDCSKRSATTKGWGHGNGLVLRAGVTVLVSTPEDDSHISSHTRVVREAKNRFSAKGSLLQVPVSRRRRAANRIGVHSVAVVSTALSQATTSAVVPFRRQSNYKRKLTS